MAVQEPLLQPVEVETVGEVVAAAVEVHLEMVLLLVQVALVEMVIV